MKYFYDTEFIDTGRTIDLISIGIVREDGKTYYGVNSDIDVIQRAFNHPWLRANVCPSLPFYERAVDFSVALDTEHQDFDNAKPRVLIARDVKDFICSDPEPELWAYYAAYDHVALAQLFGRMLDLPTGIPMFTNDIKQEMVRLKNPRVPEQQEGAHNALADAQWNKSTYEYLQALTTTFKGVLNLSVDPKGNLEGLIGSKQIYPPVANPQRVRF